MRNDVPDSGISAFNRSALRLIVVLGCSLSAMLLGMLMYARYGIPPQAAPEFHALLAIGGAVSLVSSMFVYSIARGMFRRIERITANISHLTTYKQGKLHHAFPFESEAHSPELAGALHALRQRFEQQYTRLDRDLQLAHRVQRQLLTSQPTRWAGWRLQSVYGGASEVNGGFCAALPVSAQRLACLAGRVEGEALPAALVMSALMMMFRVHIGEASSAAHLLERLRHSLADALTGGELHVHMAAVLLDEEQHSADCAASGRMSVYVDQPGAASGRNGHAAALPDDRLVVLAPGPCFVALWPEGARPPARDGQASPAFGETETPRLPEGQAALIITRDGRDPHDG